MIVSIVALRDVTTTEARTGVRPRVGIYSFGRKFSDYESQFAQFEFDVTKFRDPSGQKQFSGKSGLNEDVQNWMQDDNRIPALIQNCLIIADDLTKPKVKQSDNGQTETQIASGWLSFSFGDHHGRWAAPAIAEMVAKALSVAGYDVAVFHRELKDVVVKREGHEPKGTNGDTVR